MEIKFTSTLTVEDENRIAPAVLTALATVLDLLPIAYRLRIDTVDSQVYQLAGPVDASVEPQVERIRVAIPDLRDLVEGPTTLPQT